jgi:CheY-like chemotaxis protein
MPPVSVDRVQIEQVLLNLCINARDAMGESGKIEVGARLATRGTSVCASCRQPLAGGFVELSVRDTGPGIAPQVMDRMFEPFYSTKEIGKGSGMGLAMAHGIVHEHGGHIVVDSTPDGTAFRLLFPAAEPESPAGPAAGGRKSARTKQRLAGRVLVVDDEEMIREFLGDLLSGWGLEVTAHTNGVEARDAFASDPHAFDLVITDQTMPRLTGLQLARTLTRIRPGVPIVLCTGYAEDLDGKDIEAAGVSTLARKPVEPEELRALLETHLSRR